jgi:hypothetical protein
VVYIRNSEEGSNFVVNVIHEAEEFNHDLRTEAWLNEMKEYLIKLQVI